MTAHTPTLHLKAAVIAAHERRDSLLQRRANGDRTHRTRFLLQQATQAALAAEAALAGEQ